MKKLSKLKINEKLNHLDKLSNKEADDIKGGYRIYYPDYKDPNVSVDINPGGGGVTYTWRF